MPLVRPDEHADPVAAVMAAHESGARLSLPTSATTGTGRRVVRTTASWWGSFDGYSALSGVGPGARVWIPGPSTSTMVLFAAVHATAIGATRVTEPHRATHACLTPAQLDRHGTDLPPDTRIVAAGAHLTERHVRAARARHQSIAHYYGAAELSFVAAGSGPEDLLPFERVEVAVREDPAPGTLWVRSPWVCEGYEGPPGPLRRDGEWASVGDLGALSDGFLRVLGRPDAVTTAGVTVLVADVEAALAPVAHGPVAVHAVPHPLLGQIVAVAFVDPDDRARLAAVARSLPPTHRPRSWRVVDELPLTAAGKVDRVALTRLAPGADAVVEPGLPLSTTRGPGASPATSARSASPATSARGAS